MPDESIFVGATLRDRFVAAVARNDEATAQALASFVPDSEPLDAQRDEAWVLLSAGSRWAANALQSAGLEGTDATDISDSESAFSYAQQLETQSWKLSQKAGFHDSVALLVDAVKRACYAGADLGPIPGGRLAAFRAPGSPPSIVHEVQPVPADLQSVGSGVGEALRRYGELGLGDIVGEAASVLEAASAEAAGA